MKKPLVSSALMMLSAAACGSGNDATNAATVGAQTAAAAPTAQSEAASAGDDAGYFLNGLPNPCDILTPARAATILGRDPPALPGNGASRTSTASCNYVVGGGKSLTLNVVLQPFETINSGTMSADALRTQLASMNDNPAGWESALPDVGKAGVAFHKGDTSYLVDVTGITGAAAISKNMRGEATIYISLNDAERTPQQRLQVLEPVVSDVYAQLDSAARGE